MMSLDRENRAWLDGVRAALTADFTQALWRWRLSPDLAQRFSCLTPEEEERLVHAPFAIAAAPPDNLECLLREDDDDAIRIYVATLTGR